MDPGPRTKNSLHRFVDLVWNDGRLERVGDFIAADYVGHDETAGVVVQGPDGLRRFVAGRRGEVPDLEVRLRDAIAEDDLVAVRWTATGGGAAWSGISVVRLLAGKQVESWTQWSLAVHLRNAGAKPGGTPIARAPDGSEALLHTRGEGRQ